MRLPASISSHAKRPHRRPGSRLTVDPVECSGEGSGGKEVSGEFVVARGDAAPVFDPTEVVFDFVPPSIETLGTVGPLGGVAATGDDGQGAFILDLLADFRAVVGFVGRNGQWWLGSVEHVADDLAVMNLATRDSEVQRAALAIDDGVDFRRPTTAADADRLILLPPFAPLAARWAFTMVLSIRYRLSRDLAASVSKIRFQMPRRDQRLNRLYAVV
jgi:hypothetical protein